MDRFIYLVFPILFLLVTSCAGLKINPPGPDVQSILVLPFTATNTSGFRYGFYYQYEIVKEGDASTTYEASFMLPKSGDILIIDILSPGNYFVTGVTVHPISSGTKTYSNTADPRMDRFKLVSGKITIFQNSINISQVKPRFEFHSTVSSYQIGSVSPDRKAKILETLKDLENFDKWEVLAMEESVQEPGGLRVIRETNQILNMELPIMVGEDGRLDSISISETSNEFNFTMTFFDKPVSNMETIISAFGREILDSQLSDAMCTSFRDSKDWSAALEGYAINVVIRDKTNKVLSEFKCD